MKQNLIENVFNTVIINDQDFCYCIDDDVTPVQ